MRYGVADWDETVRALKGATTATLACHVNPDGDALGSLLGAALTLRKAGAEVKASWGDGESLPDNYSFLPGSELLVEPGDVGGDDLFVALDCGALDRLGPLAGAAAASETLVNVDHHPGNPGFGTLNVVVTSASCTAELVTGLIEDAGFAMDDDIAVCLYTALMTDTGRFQYSNATPETLRLAARLRSFDVDASSIAQQVYESAPFGYLKLVGRVLDRAELFADQRFVYSYVTREDLEGTGVGMADTENLIDVVRSIRDADVSAIFKEQEDGGFRVSLRSKGAVSVGAIARANGGGGHELAAGFTADSIESGVESIRRALRP
jgi:phosphoesterase RecJ-like protein